MKNMLNFTTIVISIMLVLNLFSTAYIFLGHHRREKHERSFNHYKRMECAHRKMSNEGSFHKKHDRRRHHDFFLKDLDLSPEQQAKIKAVRESHMKIMTLYEDSIHKLRSKEHELLTTDRLDSIQINLLATQFGEYEKEIQSERLKHLQAIRNILTKEQKELLKAKDEEYTERARLVF